MTQGGFLPTPNVLTQDWLETSLRSGLTRAVAAEERTLFDRRASGPVGDVLLFGAGNLGRRTLAGLRRVGVEPRGFIDNDSARDGTTLDGLPVHLPEHAAAVYGRSCAVVVTIWVPMARIAFPSVARQLRALGFGRIQSFVPLYWKYAEEFLPNFCLDSPHRLYQHADDVRRAYGLLSDDDSRSEFLVQLSYLLSTMETVEIAIPKGRQWYFPRDLVHLSSNEVFVDCGAYDGDTIAAFLEASRGSFGSVIAFEPDGSAADRLRTRVRQFPTLVRERIQVHQVAVGTAAGVLRFDGDGTPGSRVSDSGSQTVRCINLDVALAGVAPTFIKMDIEGAEEDALIGAVDTIRTNRPVLAVCVYHRQEHLYRIPNLISQTCSDYTYFIRRQGPDGDLVCFAIPDERHVPQASRD